MFDARGIEISVNIVFIVCIDVDGVGLKETVFEALVQFTFVGGGQFDFAMIRIFKELAEARDYCVCVIEVILDLLRLNSRVEEGSQEVNVIAFYNINVFF